MVQAILKGLYGNYSVFINLMCHLGKTEIDAEISPIMLRIMVHLFK